jgi:lysophospholipase L1-like esterase
VSPGPGHHWGHPKLKIKFLGDSITHWCSGLCPFSAAHRDAVEARQKLVDKRIGFIDTAGWYDGPLHPDVEGSALIGAKLASALKHHI